MVRLASLQYLGVDAMQSFLLSPAIYWHSHSSFNQTAAEGMGNRALHCYSFADNARFYGRNKVPFVMGTTGGDREQLLADTKASGTYAVIAPQMGKQVGDRQAAIIVIFKATRIC